MNFIDTISPESVKKMIIKVNKSNDGINKIIEKHLVNKSLIDCKNKRFKELFQVGKFIYSIDEGYAIEKHIDKPDFIIFKGDSRIGLEHETIFIDDLKKIDGSIDDLFEFAEIKFREKYPDLKFIANIWYKTEILNFKKIEKLRIVNQINEIIINYLKTKELMPNSLIDEISISKHKHLNLCPNSGPHYVKDIQCSDIKKAIQKKESKIKSYIDNTNIEEQWLLLVIGSTGQSGLDLPDDEDSLDFNFDSSFSRVYLLHDISSKIYRLK